MTFKDIVALREPDKIGSNFGGGVFGCPCHYDYLYSFLTKEEISFESECSKDIMTCSQCWNRKVCL